MEEAGEKVSRPLQPRSADLPRGSDPCLRANIQGAVCKELDLQPEGE